MIGLRYLTKPGTQIKDMKFWYTPYRALIPRSEKILKRIAELDKAFELNKYLRDAPLPNLFDIHAGFLLFNRTSFKENWDIAENLDAGPC